MKPLRRILVTRPAAQALPWVERLRARGFDAEALPLIEIAAVDDRGEVREAWHGLASRRLVFFVSANAVEHFFAARPADVEWPEGLEAAVPGPGTTSVLRELGAGAIVVIEPAGDALQFDSEAVWARLRERDWQGASVLVVRGEGGRDWLADRLVESGASVDALSAYRRVAPAFDGEARARLDAALADGDAVWLLSSSEAVANLESAAGPGRFAGAHAVATHPRIAARARAAGFGHVFEAGPGLDAVVACIQSIGP
ncbi:MAG: uroporphyrinogen-III synthase [Caldimonas sp.]